MRPAYITFTNLCREGFFRDACVWGYAPPWARPFPAVGLFWPWLVLPAPRRSLGCDEVGWDLFASAIRLNANRCPAGRAAAVLSSVRAILALVVRASQRNGSSLPVPESFVPFDSGGEHYRSA